jgi:hypothetical protein
MEMMMVPGQWLVRRVAGAAVLAALAVAVPASAQDQTQADVHNDAQQQPSVLVILDANGLDRSLLPVDTDNELVADIGVREELPYFAVRLGQHVTLQAGAADNPGWFALRAVPDGWESEPGAGDGLQNFELAGPGLGSPDASEERETLLHTVANVVPLQAAGLQMLWGRQVCAVVYTKELAVAGDPPAADLTGVTLGILAFRVSAVVPVDGSVVNIDAEVLEAHETCAEGLTVFADAPDPAVQP